MFKPKGKKILFISTRNSKFISSFKFDKSIIMETKKILTRENIPTDELQNIVEKVYKGIKLQYNEVYYLDYVVDENTGLINKNVKEKHYTKTQMDRNIKEIKQSFDKLNVS